ncbi:purine and uridine phosphorylase [Glonium stellatum]|uniref:Purine and uridine phosphorylase n=1 Tax=Glonium stellatum TaxID=574774 RepID=A0A8E2ERB1_9PEZI|nr:purine and uridine phosphorylase [Glonium stellatum]
MENDRSEGIPADSIEVAIITALAFEGNAVDLFFDKRCRTSELPYLHNLPEFANSITVGNIRNHRIVLARTGEAGKAKASATAALVKAVFKQIKLVLVVGILAACLEFKETIKLGDVIISTGIVIYDSGTQEGDNYRQKGDGKKTDIAPFLDKLTGVWYRSELSKAAHGHLHEKLAKPPSDLEPPLKIPEKDPQMKPKVHFGYVGSGDVVIKDENFGKSIFSRNRKTIKGFEMEACGVEDSFPQKVVVIKGVSDYADLNKNDDIQQYAAYAATGYAIAFLDMRDSKTTHSQIVASEAKAFASERLEKAKNIILHGHRREPSATSSGGVLPPPKITPIPGRSVSLPSTICSCD